MLSHLNNISIPVSLAPAQMNIQLNIFRHCSMGIQAHLTITAIHRLILGKIHKFATGPLAAMIRVNHQIGEFNVVILPLQELTQPITLIFFDGHPNSILGNFLLNTIRYRWQIRYSIGINRVSIVYTCNHSIATSADCAIRTQTIFDPLTTFIPIIWFPSSRAPAIGCFKGLERN